jgi:hypothetical protein
VTRIRLLVFLHAICRATLRAARTGRFDGRCTQGRLPTSEAIGDKLACRADAAHAFVTIVRSSDATFGVVPCPAALGKGDISMRQTAAEFIRLGLNGLKRRPVLTVVVVYSIGVGIAVLMAIVAVSRAPTRCSTSSSERPYVVQMSAGSSNRSELLDRTPV